LHHFAVPRDRLGTPSHFDDARSFAAKLSSIEASASIIALAQ
jgi:hypothetical protein